MLKQLLGGLNMFVGAGIITVGFILGCCGCVGYAILALTLGILVMAGGAVLFYSEVCKDDENKQES
nr:MAG TPA: cytochrome c oxidase subunit [Caudoviricetes sp.]